MNISKLVGGMALLVSIAAVGCGGEAIVGDWEGDGDAPSENSMYIDEDLNGDGTIYFAIGEDNFYADFELAVTAEDDEYIIEWRCDGDCSELDFTMRCTLSGDEDDELDCEGDGGWSGYPFAWSRR